MSGMNISEAKAIAETNKYRYIPLWTEELSDMRTPIEVLRILRNVSSHCYLLESAESGKKWGRYTFLGFDPSEEIVCKDGKMKITENGNVREFETNDPGKVINKIIAEHKSPRIKELPPFTGGLVGYFAYDYIKYSEPSLKLDAKDEEKFNDVDLMLFDSVIAFDNYRQKIIFIHNIPAENIEENYAKGMEKLLQIKELVMNGIIKHEPAGHLKSDFRALFSKEEYCAMVEKAKKYIREGDIFQVVPSNRFDADFEGSLLNTYRILRTVNPSPYMFYLSGDDIEIAGASPETLVKLEDGVLNTFPIAGSRPRGRDDAEDEALIKDLLSDEKELSEHNMLVDLGRNDLGKICRFGSVEVDDYMTVVKYSHIMHIGSSVKGEILEGKTAADAVAAVLPAGTLSGAPKIRACEIINELENNKRGIYGGAIGYIDFTGNLDVCISIRIAYKKNGRVFVRSGGGVVADSVPEKEYQESVNKAKAVLTALKEAEEYTGREDRI